MSEETCTGKVAFYSTKWCCLSCGCEGNSWTIKHKAMQSRPKYLAECLLRLFA